MISELHDRGRYYELLRCFLLRSRNVLVLFEYDAELLKAVIQMKSLAVGEIFSWLFKSKDHMVVTYVAKFRQEVACSDAELLIISREVAGKKHCDIDRGIKI